MAASGGVCIHRREASGTGVFEDARSQDEELEEFFDDQWDEDGAEYQTMDDTPCKIQPGLFISGFLAEQNRDKLKKAGITHIVQAADGLSPSHPAEFEYFQVPVQDTPNQDLVRHFARVFDFISSAQEQQGSVLVHCVAGVSRSATLCIGYLMWQHKICYDEAFRRVHAVRPWVMPNMGFRCQLLHFESMGCDPGQWPGLDNIHTLPSSRPIQAASGKASQRAEEERARDQLTDLDLLMPRRSARSESHNLPPSFALNTTGHQNGRSQGRTQPGTASSAHKSTYIPELGTSF